MKIDRKQIFRELEPPPGGAARLRTKLESSRHRGLNGWWLAPTAAVIVAAVVVFVFGTKTDPTAGPAPDRSSLLAAEEFDRLLGRESVPYELTVRRGDEPLAVTELESSNPRVRLYRLVEATATNADAGGPP